MNKTTRRFAHGIQAPNEPVTDCFGLHGNKQFNSVGLNTGRLPLNPGLQWGNSDIWLISQADMKSGWFSAFEPAEPEVSIKERLSCSTEMRLF
jgi:hypothetical protein